LSIEFVFGPGSPDDDAEATVGRDELARPGRVATEPALLNPEVGALDIGSFDFAGSGETRFRASGNLDNGLAAAADVD
jgi:hypothetical protein